MYLKLSAVSEKELLCPLPRKIDASLAKFLLVSFIPVKEVSVFSCEKGQSFYLGDIHKYRGVGISKIEAGLVLHPHELGSDKP